MKNKQPGFLMLALILGLAIIAIVVLALTLKTQKRDLQEGASVKVQMEDLQNKVNDYNQRAREVLED